MTQAQNSEHNGTAANETPLQTASQPSSEDATEARELALALVEQGWSPPPSSEDAAETKHDLPPATAPPVSDRPSTMTIGSIPPRRYPYRDRR